MKMASLFDGSGGFPLGGIANGFEPIWASEVEPFPILVTKTRIPSMNHYGNIRNIDGNKVEPVDLITGGSPCQDLSVAGKRRGMKLHCPLCGYSVDAQEDEEFCPICDTELKYTRSGLFMEQIRIVKEMRDATNGKYPRFMLWGNGVALPCVALIMNDIAQVLRRDELEDLLS